MKSAILSLALLGATMAASQGATLIFTNVGAGALATGFGDRSGNDDAGLVWGVVVDTNGNGFNHESWSPDFTYNSGVGGIVLGDGDVLFLHNVATTSRTGDGAETSGAVNSINSVTYTNGVNGNQNFAIIWFDRGIALNSQAAGGQYFGLVTSGLNPAPGFTLPAGEADSTDYSPAFLGTDQIKIADRQLVPEPSALLLGALGFLGLARRRR